MLRGHVLGVDVTAPGWCALRGVLRLRQMCEALLQEYHRSPELNSGCILQEISVRFQQGGDLCT